MINPYYLAEDGVYEPIAHVQHREDEYPEDGFATLWTMQQRHFWYRGRYRFLQYALDSHCPTTSGPLSAIDIGGGVGGWVRYLAERHSSRYRPLALADSSLTALRMASDVLPTSVDRYHVDLMNLHMHEDWDIAFLLDVLEHLPDDRRALKQAKEALKPGGLLFVTTPAFQQFWSYNDDLAHHLRRYTRVDFARLAKATGLTLLDARYFMFFLSPLYLLSRMKPGFNTLSDDEKKTLVLKQHQIPAKPFNSMFTAVFAAETPVGHWLRFPWGTSILGVFKKARNRRFHR